MNIDSTQVGLLDGFSQTYSCDALWDKDEHFRLWVRKVKVQVHDEIKCAGSSTLRVEAFST